MGLGHERLDVYRLAIEYVAWVYGKAETLRGIHRPARDQWLRASQSIPLNIAEGAAASREILPPTGSRKPISIPIAISIPMKSNPNKRMHWTLILRASDP